MFLYITSNKVNHLIVTKLSKYLSDMHCYKEAIGFLGSFMKKHYLTSLNELFEISLKRRKQFRGWLLMPFLGTRPLITIIIVLRWFVLGVAWHILCVFRCCWKRFAAAYVFPKIILLFVSVLCEIFMTRDQQISNAKFHINKA